MSVTIILIYLGVGAIAGVLAGLLGVGGGLVIVPMLVYCFTLQGLPNEHIMHIALGTSMASIIFTSVSSFMAHHKKGAVNWTVVKTISGGIVIGTFAGTWLAAGLSTAFLKGFFVIFLYYVATQKTSRLPGPSRPCRYVYSRGNHRRRLQPCRDRRRLTFRTLHGMVQPACA